MELAHATMDDANAVVDCWLSLAADQRTHGSRLCVAENRDVVSEMVARHVVDNELIVARERGEMIGFVMFSIQQPTYRQTERVGIVSNLYVRPAARNNGVGGTLLTAAEDDLIERGADTISLEVLADNTAAQRFYRRHGYESHRMELAKSTENDTHSKANQ